MSRKNGKTCPSPVHIPSVFCLLGFFYRTLLLFGRLFVAAVSLVTTLVYNILFCVAPVSILTPDRFLSALLYLFFTYVVDGHAYGYIYRAWARATDT